MKWQHSLEDKSKSNSHNVLYIQYITDSGEISVMNRELS